jgi:hypothetical protein
MPLAVVLVEHHDTGRTTCPIGHQQQRRHRVTVGAADLPPKAAMPVELYLVDDPDRHVGRGLLEIEEIPHRGRVRLVHEPTLRPATRERSRNGGGVAVVHDPWEGVTPDGMIRTGASRRAIAARYDPVLRAAIDAVADRGSLYVYGSVATGTARVPTSDVDLLTIGVPRPEASQIATDLSVRFRDRCREVSIGPASWEDHGADTDEGYGLQVFLRHYCVHLGGADPAADLPEHPADARAARGFNGDIARHRARWLVGLEEGRDVARLGTRIARKTLLAVAGLVSMRDATWSTDRRGCAARWAELEPDPHFGTLVAWLDAPPQDPEEIHRVLLGPVAGVIEAFESDIGLWDDEQAEPPG